MNKLDEYRRQLEKIDKSILDLLAKRFIIVRKIGSIKKDNNLPIIDIKQEEEKINQLSLTGKKLGIEKNLIRSVWSLIFKNSYILEK